MTQHRSVSRGAGRWRKRGPMLQLEPLEPRQLLSMAKLPVAARLATWTINGTDANDVISVAYSAATQKFDLTMNGVLVESRPASKVRQFVINGGKGDDTITLNTGGKKIPAIIHGGAGNDTITGGDGENFIYGDAGNDTLIGGGGTNHLNGGADGDILIGGAGKNHLDGSAGNNTLYAIKGQDSYIQHRSDTIINSHQPPPIINPPADGGGAGPRALQGDIFHIIAHELADPGCAIHMRDDLDHETRLCEAF